MKKISVFYLLMVGILLSAAVVVSGLTPRSGSPQNSNSSTTNPPADVAEPQVDLSGTYTGGLALTGSHEMSGPGTININGNQITIEAGGMTHNGRIYAVTTRGYTGVTMYFPEVADSATKAGLVVMARAKKKGDRLTLTPVPNARNNASFQ